MCQVIQYFITLPITFQKGSPYLDDANKLIYLANQMGLIQNEITKNLPNATQCLTWSLVQASHMKKGQNVVYRIEHIYGMIILLAIGLSAAMLVLFGELTFYKAIHQKKNSASRLHEREKMTKQTQARQVTRNNKNEILLVTSGE